MGDGCAHGQPPGCSLDPAVCARCTPLLAGLEPFAAARERAERDLRLTRILAWYAELGLRRG